MLAVGCWLWFEGRWMDGWIECLAFITFDLVNNFVGILYIIFNVFLYAVVVFLVNGKNKMNE